MFLYDQTDNARFV